MTMPEMQKAISKLRFLLASIKGKEEELESLARQFRRQLERAPNHAIHGGNSLEATLNIMNEIQERLDDVEQSRAHLAAIKKRAQSELQALELTDKIEQAKTRLASLKMRLTASGEGAPEELEEITELERFIDEASIRAGRAITGEGSE
ncbi:MAG: hypothetical protein L0177_03715 [Chloroflexi bacterium]|nr:hypothetical protein [Chloroflexota bacterium]